MCGRYATYEVFCNFDGLVMVLLHIEEKGADVADEVDLDLFGAVHVCTSLHCEFVIVQSLGDRKGIFLVNIAVLKYSVFFLYYRSQVEAEIPLEF